MGYEINETHDASLQSFVASAAGSDFPIQSLPFGVFEREEGDNRIGVAIGDEVLDLEACASAGLFDGENEQEDELIAIACSILRPPILHSNSKPRSGSIATMVASKRRSLERTIALPVHPRPGSGRPQPPLRLRVTSLSRSISS